MNHDPVNQPEHCAFPDCGRPRKSFGLCNGHNEQRRNGRTLAPLPHRRRAADVLRRNSAGQKKCPTCQVWRDMTEFSRSASRPDGRYFHCKDCERTAQLRVRYGISRDRYEAMLARQSHQCAVCGTPNPGRRGWSVDHDHSCCASGRSCGKCIRGILCHRCNTGIGLMGDSPARMIRAAEYLSTNTLQGAPDWGGETWTVR